MIKSVILTVILSISVVFADSFSEFKKIAELSYLYKMQINESYVYLKKVMSKNYLLTARDIKLISSEVKKRVDLAETSAEFMDSKRSTLYNYSNTRQNFLDVTMYLGVFVATTDSYYYAYDQFSRNFKIRRIIEEDNLSNGQKANTFTNSMKKLFSFSNRKDVLKAISIFNKYKSSYSLDKKIKKTSKLISSSYTFSNRKDLGFHSSISGYANFIKNRLKSQKSTALYKLREKTLKILYAGSKIFGNSVGRVQTRRGKLYNSNDFISKTRSKLRPLDTLLEKTPFRLTDKFIPGFWGHAAIYIGTEKDLKELGLWNHPKVKKYQAKIKAGNTIVEALRSGVEINSVKSFSDIDDFTILRLKQNLSLDEKRDYILSVISHIGKDYDFAFNVETPSKIVCSELHYLTYLDVKFDIEFILGQPTISVDSVAAQGVMDKAFSPISLYLDGSEKNGNIQSHYESVLSEASFNLMGLEEKFKVYLD